MDGTLYCVLSIHSILRRGGALRLPVLVNYELKEIALFVVGCSYVHFNLTNSLIGNT